MHIWEQFSGSRHSSMSLAGTESLWNSENSTRTDTGFNSTKHKENKVSEKIAKRFHCNSLTRKHRLDDTTWRPSQIVVYIVSQFPKFISIHIMIRMKTILSPHMIKNYWEIENKFVNFIHEYSKVERIVPGETIKAIRELCEILSS